MNFLIKTTDKISSWKYSPQLILLLLLFIGYWQLSTFHYTLMYDMMDCYYPWRYMVGECLQNGMLPWWNPYEVLGYPLHADPQSGAWYPFVWIIGGIWGYDIYALEIEFLIHVYLAAAGMFLLGRTLNFTRGASFLIAAAYMFCGFIIGNEQHFTWIISATWIPFILAYYFKFAHTGKYMQAISSAFFMFLLITGGYPAFLMILGYLMIVLFIYFSTGYIIKKEWKRLFSFVKLNAAFLAASLLFSAVVLVSIIEASAYITRADKLPLALALFCPLSPQCLTSFIIPFAVVKNLNFFDTDLSMSNIYMGLAVFTLFIFSLFLKKPGMIKVLLWWGIFCLAAAMGKYLPVREFLYDYIPMMGFFRFPSLFRLFVIISFLVCAGFGFDYLFNSYEKKKRKILFIIIPILLLLASAAIYSKAQGYLALGKFIQEELFIASSQATIWQHIALQSVIQIFFLEWIILIFLKVKDTALKKRLFILIACADLLAASWLNEPYTTYSHLYTAKYTKEISKSFPDDFPIPKSTDVLMNNDTCGIGKGTFWKNLNIYYKQVAWDGNTPFKFKGYVEMVDSFPNILRSSLCNPPVFLSKKILPADSMKLNETKKLSDHRNVYLDSNDDYSLMKNALAHAAEDTVIIEKFIPTEITLKVKSKNKQMLCLLQNYYPGWTVTINDNPGKIETFNKGLMCVAVDGGDSTVKFSYRNKNVLIAFYVSAISLLIFLMTVFFPKIRNLFSVKKKIS